jgi:hypothetical protein
MEKVKDPAMVLSVVDLLGLVGTIFYFYKQNEAIRSDMVKITQTLGGVVRKLAEMEKSDQQKGEVLHGLNEQIKQLDQRISEVPNIEFADMIDGDLDEIVAALADNSIEVDRAKSYSQPRRSGDRRGPSRRPTSEPDVDDRRDRRGSGRDSRLSSRPSSRDSVVIRDNPRESTRDTGRDTGREPIREPRLQPAQSAEDDTDLIGDVRRHQGH